MHYHKIKNLLLLITLTLCIYHKAEAKNAKPVVYLIPAQGTDYRIFKNLEIDTSFQVKYINYFTPDKNTNLPDYAHALSSQIDTTHPFILVGVSLGGMLATEMSSFLHPEKVILISSAKCRNELPSRYTFQKNLPIYKLVSGKTAKFGAKVLQPIVEPDRNNEKEVCKAMLNDIDPPYLKRTIKMILEWERIKYPENIIHIHGDNDHTIPIRNVKYNYLVKDGSHMMVLTRGKEISDIINEIIIKE